MLFSTTKKSKGLASYFSIDTLCSYHVTFLLRKRNEGMVINSVTTGKPEELCAALPNLGQILQQGASHC